MTLFGDEVRAMAASSTGSPPYALSLARGLIRDGGPSISLGLLVSRWMAQAYSAQVLLEQLGALLRSGDLGLVHDPEDTRVYLCGPHSPLRATRHSQYLSYGEGVDFAAAVARAHQAAKAGSDQAVECGAATSLRRSPSAEQVPVNTG
jgi:hypothetical protein